MSPTKMECSFSTDPRMKRHLKPRLSCRHTRENQQAIEMPVESQEGFRDVSPEKLTDGLLILPAETELCCQRPGYLYICRKDKDGMWTA